MSGPARLDLELPERVRARLDELRAMSNAADLVEVITRALAAYDVLLTVCRERGDVIVLRRDGARSLHPVARDVPRETLQVKRENTDPL